MCLKLEVSHTSQDCIPASWSNLPSPLLTLHHLFISHFEILAFGLSGIIFVKCRWKKVFNVFSFKKEKQNFTVTACWQIYRKSLSLVSLFKSNIALCGCRTSPPPFFFFFGLVPFLFLPLQYHSFSMMGCFTLWKHVFLDILFPVTNMILDAPYASVSILHWGLLPL